MSNHLTTNFAKWSLVDQSYEVTNIANRAYWQGMKDHSAVERHAVRLASLLDHILHIAAYSEKHKMYVRLIDLAEKFTGKRDLIELAGEISARLDTFALAYSACFGQPLAATDPTVFSTAKSIHNALEAIINGDDGEALRGNEIINIAGAIGEWQPPETWGRPLGENPETAALVGLAKEFRKIHPKGWWRVGVAIMNHFKEIAKTKGTLEGTDATLYKILYVYFDQATGAVINKRDLGSYLSNLVSKYKNVT